MDTIYLFNPENDLALACGEVHYTPPKHPLKMATDLASLPRWYAPEGERAKWITLDRLREGADFSTFRLSPWGWSSSIIHRARLAGFKEETLPSQEQAALFRELSHRQTAVQLLCEMRKEEPSFFCGDSAVCRSMEEVEKFHGIHRRTLLKAPWSCNGRGLMQITYDDVTPQTRGWILGLIKSQGSIVTERLQDKVCDFAMEFYADGAGKVAFSGYSLFQTDGGGRYAGNILATDHAMETHLTQWISRELLHEVREMLIVKLSALLAPSGYEGYLGVDMLVARGDAAAHSEQGSRLLPCVEINLRMNMGMVAHCLSEQFIQRRDDCKGLYRVDYFPDPEVLKRDHEENKCKYPLLLNGDFPTSGYFPLTPILKDTQYRAAVWL